MTIPEVSTELRQALERHRFLLRLDPDTPPGEELVGVFLNDSGTMRHAGQVGHHLGLWSAYAVVRDTGIWRRDEVGRHEWFEDAVLDVLMSFTHVE